MFALLIKHGRFHFGFQSGGGLGISATTQVGLLPTLDCLHTRLFSSIIIASPSTPKTKDEIERGRILGISATTQLGLHTRLFSSTIASPSTLKTEDEIERGRIFRVSYLINSCGLSPEIAQSVAHKVNFPNPTKPDSVLKFLRDHGFSNLHISKAVAKYPRLLSAHPEKTLLPKLEFYRSLGFLSSDLADTVASNPRPLLHYSLKHRVIPCCDFLGSNVRLDEKVVSILKRWPWVLMRDVEEDFSAKVTILRRHGVPQPSLTKLIYQFPLLVNATKDNLDRCLKEVVNLGFDPLKMAVFEAANVFLRGNKSTWDRKVKVYKGWGWSDHEVSLMFRRYPRCMGLSEKKIMSGMDFLVNEMGFQLTSIARHPIVLGFSLGRRIIPRCCVIRVLILKGLIRKDIGCNTFLKLTDKCFLDDFVTKYEEQVPHLLSIYQAKCSISEPVALEMRALMGL